ncbi:MAG TPA: hypothetical protein DCP63_13595 [Bacteroidetes bacterium]|nr:hypothetical protein [Bacteroidota bacterium]
MMNVADVTRVKQAMLQRVDLTLREQFHQSLTEVLTELRIRNVLTEKNPTPENVFEVLLQTHVLGYASDSKVLNLRDALERFTHGSFGSCSRCGRELPIELLEKDPTATTCPTCRPAWLKERHH